MVLLEAEPLITKAPAVFSSSAGSNETDKYELFHYYVTKLETRTNLTEIYMFLIEFLRTISQHSKQLLPACIFTVNQETMDFEPAAMTCENIEPEIFKHELSILIKRGIVAWSITNRRPALSHSEIYNPQNNCLVIPLSTIEHTLGLALIYINISEDELSRESLSLISLACTQTALYVDNIIMVQELKQAQMRLIHTEKLSAIGQLAAGVAHEINNPIGYITSNSEVLIEYIEAMKQILLCVKDKTPQTTLLTAWDVLNIDFILGDIGKLMKANIDGLKRVSEIVTNLKGFSRCDTKAIFEEVNMADALLNTLMIANNEIKYNSTVVTKFDHTSPVMCNIGEIKQVFLNIIVNAAQAIAEQSRKEKGTITIHTRQDETAFYCEIADNGPGIPAENRQKIFDPFFTTKPVGKGTGLGLNIAYDIVVKKHCGELTVHSEVGQGTCFTIKLPLVQ